MIYTTPEYQAIKRFLTSRLTNTEKGVDKGRFNLCNCCDALIFTPEKGEKARVIRAATPTDVIVVEVLNALNDIYLEEEDDGY